MTVRRLCQFAVRLSWLAEPLPACYASASSRPLTFESLTASKRGRLFNALFPLACSVFGGRREGGMVSAICQDTSMISMLPEKLDCLPILPSSSRVRVSEMPSSNSI